MEMTNNKLFYLFCGIPVLHLFRKVVCALQSSPFPGWWSQQTSTHLCSSFLLHFRGAMPENVLVDSFSQCCKHEAAHDHMSFFPSTTLEEQCRTMSSIWNLDLLDSLVIENVLVEYFSILTKVSAWLWSCSLEARCQLWWHSSWTCNLACCLLVRWWICLEFDNAFVSIIFADLDSAWIFFKLPHWPDDDVPHSGLLVPLLRWCPIEAGWMWYNGFCFFCWRVLLKLDVNYAWIQCACCNGSPCLVLTILVMLIIW